MQMNCASQCVSHKYSQSIAVCTHIRHFCYATVFFNANTESRKLISLCVCITSSLLKELMSLTSAMSGFFAGCRKQGADKGALCIITKFMKCYCSTKLLMDREEQIYTKHKSIISHLMAWNVMTCIVKIRARGGD